MNSIGICNLIAKLLLFNVLNCPFYLTNCCTLYLIQTLLSNSHAPSIMILLYDAPQFDYSSIVQPKLPI